jgi:peroxiredoxin 5
MAPPAPGSPFPDVELHGATPGESVKLLDALGDGPSIVVSVPGAFTPTCNSSHLPGFIEHADELRAAGAKEIIFVWWVCYCCCGRGKWAFVFRRPARRALPPLASHPTSLIHPQKTRHNTHHPLHSPNDAFVTAAWGESLKAGQAGVKLLADPHLKLAKALDQVTDGTADALGGPRAKRFSCVVRGGVLAAGNWEPEGGTGLTCSRAGPDLVAQVKEAAAAQAA